MTAVLLVLSGILGVIGLAILTLMAADWIARQRFDEWNELDEWRRKVEAMRRMQDEEGAA